MKKLLLTFFFVSILIAFMEVLIDRGPYSIIPIDSQAMFTFNFIYFIFRACFLNALNS